MPARLPSVTSPGAPTRDRPRMPDTREAALSRQGVSEGRPAIGPGVQAGRRRVHAALPVRRSLAPRTRQQGAPRRARTKDEGPVSVRGADGRHYPTGCPGCGAEQGQPCVTRAGGATTAHVARVRAANVAERERRARDRERTQTFDQWERGRRRSSGRVQVTATEYDHAHRVVKEAARPDVDAGRAWCAELVCLLPDRWIAPGTPWDLAHDRAAGPGRYLGPAHERCNRAEGARYGNRLRAGREPEVPSEGTRWPL